MSRHVIYFFLFFCLVKLFFFLLFVRISTIMVNKDEYIFYYFHVNVFFTLKDFAG